MDSTSISLLRRLRQPNPGEAWNRMVAVYAPLIFHWARRKGLQAADASDLVQEVLLTVIREMPNFEYDPQQRFRGWLRTITVRRAIDLQRRNQRQAATTDHAIPVEELDRDDPLDLFVEVEFRRELIRNAFGALRQELSEETWQIARRQLVEGLSAAEAASERGVSINVAYLAKSRTLARLRQLLKELPD